MIELHRPEQDKFADEIDDRLNAMVVAFRSVVHPGSPDSDRQNSSPQTSTPLPHIRESGKMISRKEEIFTWLDELDRELQQQRSVSGDSCYIDPESGKIC